jgi:hypothetical protein
LPAPLIETFAAGLRFYRELHDGEAQQKGPRPRLGLVRVRTSPHIEIITARLMAFIGDETALLRSRLPLKERSSIMRHLFKQTGPFKIASHPSLERSKQKLLGFLLVRRRTTCSGDPAGRHGVSAGRLGQLPRLAAAIGRLSTRNATSEVGQSIMPRCPFELRHQLWEIQVLYWRKRAETRCVPIYQRECQTTATT